MVKVINKHWLPMIAAIIDMIKSANLKYSIHIRHDGHYTEQMPYVNTSLAYFLI